jgi:hypothetical protein
MTETSFTVDPDGLDNLRGQLSAIQATMQDIGSITGCYSPADLGTTPQVWNALQSFNSNWSDGISKIGNNVAALVVLLAKAAADYRGTDEQIAQAAAPPSAPPSGTTSSGTTSSGAT